MNTIEKIRRQLPALGILLGALIISGGIFTYYVYLGINEADSSGWYFFGPWGMVIALGVCIAPFALASSGKSGFIGGTILGIVTAAFLLFVTLVWKPSFVVNVDMGSLGFGLVGLLVFAAAYAVYVAGARLSNNVKSLTYRTVRRTTPVVDL